MKINILVIPLGYYNSKYAVECNSYEEINKLNPNAIDKYTFSYIKSLERNTNLESEIKKSRISLGIPRDGYTKKEYDDYRKSSRLPYDPNGNIISIEYKKEFGLLMQNLHKETRRIRKIFSIIPLVDASLKYLIIHNGIYETNTAIYVENDFTNPLLDINVARIVIQKKVSKNHLIRFIKENWDAIEEAMEIENVADNKELYISDRDFKIIELREKTKLKYVEIADLISEEYQDHDINEDSIKTAYKRAINKIKATNDRTLK